MSTVDWTLMKGSWMKFLNRLGDSLTYRFTTTENQEIQKTELEVTGGHSLHS